MATEQIHENNILYELFKNVESKPCPLHCLTNDYCHYLIVVCVTEHEMSTGWPLGLEIMSTRLRVMEGLQSQAVPAPAPAPAPAEEPYSIHVRAISFSSFSSSNIDTESTASFFQDNSVSLGRLIGFKAGNGRSLYFPNAIRFEEHERIALRGTSSDVSEGQGICIPLLLKMSRSRIKSKTVTRRSWDETKRSMPQLA